LTKQPLKGIKVLDLGHYIAGPYCGKLMADMGAEVIKIEPPSGEPGRRLAPFIQDKPSLDSSLPFFYLNSNKKGITINLKTDNGISILKDFIKKTDVIIENFSPGTLNRLGIGYDTIHSINSSAVVVSISNFGQTGPYRDYKATEIIEYALGGLMSIFGAYDKPPIKHALNQAQIKAGTNAANAALMAIYWSKLNGKGQHIDVSIHECIAYGLRDTTSNYTYTGAVRRRQPNHSGDLTRIRQVSDGFILPNPNVNTSRGLDWDTVARFIGSEELIDDRFSTPTARLQNAEDLGEILDRSYGHQKKFETFYKAHELRFIYGIVLSAEEVLENPQYLHRNYFVDVRHPIAGDIKFPGAPFKLSKTPAQFNSVAPTLGQHNQEIFKSVVNLTEDQIANMRSAQIL
tara:strand:- start:17038 stop:18243 length:1206 start_codon:yes stop_codon:yes gene_type:complete